MTEPFHATDTQPNDPVDELAEHLRELGAETESERRVKRVIPWVSSIVIHAGLIIVGFLVVSTVQLLNQEEPVEIIADFDQLQYMPLSMTNLNQAVENQQTLQDKVRTKSISQTLDTQLRDLDIDPISLLSDAASRQTFSEFAPAPKQGTATFAGLRGSNARKIVYIVDASGSMITSFNIIIDELERSIDALSPEQEFSVIFFQKNEALVVPPETGLVQAVPSEKIRAMEWIRDQVTPIGRSNPLAAIEKGLSFDPDVVFLLSTDITGSGQFEIDQKDLLALLRGLNPIDPETGRRQTQIQCIQFLDPDPLGTLEKIALEHGGEKGYKFLDRLELGIGN